MGQRSRLAAGLALWVSVTAITWAAQQQAAPEPVARKIGAVKAINGQTITLKADSGPDVNIIVQDSTRVAQLPAGQTDLKAAVPIQLKDVQVGDRMLARGKPGEDGQSVVASLVIVMKSADLAQKQQHDREDWQKRGVGGIVTGIDASGGTVTVSVTPTYSIAIKTSPKTGFLRYAPDSIKFSDARHGTFDQIKAGDQLRARGDRSEDGKQVTAEEIVSGSFRNIAGTVTSVDAADNTIHVMDLITKKPVLVKVTSDSQLRKLTPQMAQGLAMLLKGRPERPEGAPPAPAPAGAPGGRPGGPPDLQRMLGRVPAVNVADLQKGDALMIVSTQGEGASPVSVITLLAGVEPVLTASSNASGAATLLSGWNMSASMGDAGSQ
ncbi:MAG TPA: DUF5666 domain-containing protein [Candidatus Angelobacter sp.]|nr:DUF5666 domain-containing protein [Candidatus Angelobacter sp.]